MIFLGRGPGPFQELGTSYEEVFWTYVLCGIVGGAIIGLLRPLYGSVAGGALAGFLVALVFYGAIAFTAHRDLPVAERLFLTMVIAVLVGVPAGVYHVRAERASRERS